MSKHILEQIGASTKLIVKIFVEPLFHFFLIIFVDVTQVQACVGHLPSLFGSWTHSMQLQFKKRKKKKKWLYTS